MTFWDWCSTYPWAAMVFLLYVGFVAIVMTVVLAAGFAYNSKSESKEDE